LFAPCLVWDLLEVALTPQRDTKLAEATPETAALEMSHPSPHCRGSRVDQHCRQQGQSVSNWIAALLAGMINSA
jgi:hypothetical protein